VPCFAVPPSFAASAAVPADIISILAKIAAVTIFIFDHISTPPLFYHIGNCILDRITGFTGLKCKENGNRVPLLQQIQAVAASLC
jgi:hypothetical protein